MKFIVLYLINLCLLLWTLRLKLPSIKIAELLSAPSILMCTEHLKCLTAERVEFTFLT